MMTVMSIIACKIMEDEIVWLLANDPEVDNVIIVKNENISEFTEKLVEEDISFRILPFQDVQSAVENEDKSKLSIVINILELGLHAVPKILKSDVYRTIKDTIPFSTGILLFYGLCGNVLGKVEQDFCLENDGCIVRILKDDVRIVDDCIGATVGGGANYLNLLKTHSKEPAFFFTPMYASSWRELLSVDRYNSDPEKALQMAKMVNDMAGYSRVAKVNTGLTYVKNIDEKIEEYAKLFGYTVFEVSGNQEIFEKCYLSMKEELNTISD